MYVATQQAVIPTLMFGPLPLLYLADMRAGGGCSVPPDDKPGTLAIPLPTIPPGCIVCFIPPEAAVHFRPSIQAAKAKGATQAAIEVNGVRLFIYCDLPLGGQPMFTEGIGMAARPIRTHAVPKGSIVVVLTPDLAEKVRPGLKAAIAEAARLERQGNAQLAAANLEAQERALKNGHGL